MLKTHLVGSYTHDFLFPALDSHTCFIPDYSQPLFFKLEVNYGTSTSILLIGMISSRQVELMVFRIYNYSKYFTDFKTIV